MARSHSSCAETADSGGLAEVAYNVGEVPGDSTKRSGRQAAFGYMNGPVNAIASYDLLHDANDLERRVITVGGNVKFAGKYRLCLVMPSWTPTPALRRPPL